MAQKTIHLGSNAFDAEREIFSPIDIDGEKKSSQKRGAENGRVNSPNSQALTLDAVEQGIIAQIAQTAGQTGDALQQYFTGFNERLMPIVNTWDAEALTNKIQAIPNRVNNSLDNIFSTFQTKSNITGDEWRSAKKEYDDFRQKNKLIRDPDYDARNSSVIWLFVLLVGEAGLNAFLLSDLTGILAAVAQTLLITSVNVFIFAALFGLFFRYKNHVSWKVRWLSLLCLPVLFWVLMFNLGVGHYRDALVEAKAQAEQVLSAPLDWDASVVESVGRVIDYTKQAWENLTISPFGIESILSILLIIVGIGFFGFAALKWYFMHDPYPGYKKRGLARRKAHKMYQDLLETTRTKMSKKIDDANNRVADERTKIQNMRGMHNDLINRAETLQKRYEAWIVVLNAQQNELVADYRTSNRQARSEPEPDYFNDGTNINPTLIEPPSCNFPELQNVDQVIETVRKAEHRIQAIADEIWERFNRIANMQSDSDESQLS